MNPLAQAHMVARGGFGYIDPPAFAFDLSKGALTKKASFSGLQRYGKEPQSSDEDTRPLASTYSRIWQGIWQPQGDAPDLIKCDNSPTVGGNPNPGSDALGFSQPDTTPDKPKSYTSPFTVQSNGAWTISAFFYAKDKKQKLKLDWWRWGEAGAGCLFQLRDGRAEFGFLSENWSEGEYDTLKLLWTLQKPTSGEKSQISVLLKKLFENWTSLSFENNVGRSDWYGGLFEVTFIAEERGAVHIILEGLDALQVENTRITATRKPGVVWTDTAVTHGSDGGAFFFSAGFVEFADESKVTHGPFWNGYWADALGDCSFSYNISKTDAQSISSQMMEYDSTAFGFETTITNSDTRRTPWLYALSARLAPAERTSNSTQRFDSDAPYVPVNAATPKETNPILDVEPSYDGALSRRTARVTMRDVLGRTSGGNPDLAHRMADLLIGDEPFFTNAIVTSQKRANVKGLWRNLARVFTLKSNSQLIITLSDGWQILEETPCEPPPIGDGLRLGEHLRALLKHAGFTDYEVEGVSANDGKKLPKAALGEDWAQRADGDSMVSDAIRSLLECYGLGWKFWQNNLGVWQFKRAATQISGVFSSDGAVNSSKAEPGRLAILDPVDLSKDSNDFFNDFIVVGGEKGEIVRTYTNWASVKRDALDSKNWIGRKKTKKVRNTGLRSADDVEYALRSLEWMYGRGGERALFETFFHHRFWPGARIECDGGTWEIEGMSGGSLAKDRAQFSVLEVL
jgi:hypothetical protein